MSKYIDLHIHSNFSEDADLSVEEIFDLANELSISAISIADHDSIESIRSANAVKDKYPIEYVPAVEITTVFPVDGSQQHILGYYINNESPVIQEALNYIEKLRIEITKKRILALKDLGFIMDEDRIWEMTGDRPPGATSAMLEVLNNVENANDKRLHEYLHGKKKRNRVIHFYRDYLTEGKPAYIPFQSITVEEGIDVIKRSGGIPVLAHPIFIKEMKWLDIIVDSGIQGFEAISTYHNKSEVEFYMEFARKHGLLITAGSDFHGPSAKPKIKLGGQAGMEYDYLEKLKAFHEKKSG